MTTGWHWTAQEDAVLRTMWSAGEPAAAIAKRLGRTANAVCCRARYLTLALRSRDKRRRSTANRFRGYATRGMRHRCPLPNRVRRAHVHRNGVSRSAAAHHRYQNLLELERAQ
ncbi:MAG: GcrA family cell cycle regulator [Vulcanimicrobiaceae bacterium]